MRLEGNAPSMIDQSIRPGKEVANRRTSCIKAYGPSGQTELDGHLCDREA
jgi:hypothetical protein